jgi:hypothetical protein
VGHNYAEPLIMRSRQDLYLRLCGPPHNRKNWLFAGSDGGGHTAAVLCRAVASRQRHRLDPFVDLRDLLTRLREFPADRLKDLLPDRLAAPRATEPATVAADPIP